MAVIIIVTGKEFLNCVFNSKLIILLLEVITMKDFVMWNHTSIKAF